MGLKGTEKEGQDEEGRLAREQKGAKMVGATPK